MVDALRPILARLIGSLVAALATWLATRWGIQLDEGARGQLTAGLLSVALGVFGVVYSLVHRAVSTRVNPADAATPALAEKGKQEQVTQSQEQKP